MHRKQRLNVIALNFLQILEFQPSTVEFIVCSNDLSGSTSYRAYLFSFCALHFQQVKYEGSSAGTKVSSSAGC